MIEWKKAHQAMSMGPQPLTQRKRVKGGVEERLRGNNLESIAIYLERK
jgi:hypothetical protein